MKELKNIRKKNNLTTIDLARKMDVVPSTITNWELGTRIPNAENIIKLSEILGCTADELLGIKKTPADGR